jgi:hypothetical protein
MIIILKMSIIRLVWKFCGYGNAAYIAGHNISHGCYGVYLESINNEGHRKTSWDRAGELFFESIPVLLLGCIKSALYGITGPIGTARILMAHYETHVTGDNGYVDVIQKLGLGDSFEHNKYIFPPAGRKPWALAKKNDE